MPTSSSLLPSSFLPSFPLSHFHTHTQRKEFKVTALRYQFTFRRIAAIKKKKENKYWQKYGSWKPTHGMYSDVTWRMACGFSKIKYRGTISSNNSTFRYKAKRTTSRGMNIYLHTKYSTQIYPQLPTGGNTPVSINRWVHKQKSGVGTP